MVVEDRHGHLWAIQAKTYDAAYRITKRDVDTFLAESGRPQVSFRLLIATCASPDFPETFLSGPDALYLEGSRWG
ncbi:MAG: hypothetical protein ACM4D3_09385 [Candidatus Sericytochromatia bacterium]